MADTSFRSRADLLTYLLGVNHWSLVGGYTNGGHVYELYSHRCRTGKFDYVVVAEAGQVVEVIDCGRRIHRNIQEFIDGQGI